MQPPREIKHFKHLTTSLTSKLGVNSRSTLRDVAQVYKQT